MAEKIALVFIVLAEKMALILTVLFNLLTEFAGFLFVLVMVLKYPGFVLLGSCEVQQRK